LTLWTISDEGTTSEGNREKPRKILKLLQTRGDWSLIAKAVTSVSDTRHLA
jgi:hypothetical protein